MVNSSDQLTPGRQLLAATQEASRSACLSWSVCRSLGKHDLSLSSGYDRKDTAASGLLNIVKCPGRWRPWVFFFA